MIKLKGLDHHLHCPMDVAWMVFLIVVASENMALILNEITYAYENETIHFDATHPIIIS